MAWYLNHYKCEDCGRDWRGEWSCTCDDDCPHCGARHMSPLDSDDLTEIIIKDGDGFVVLHSPESAEHHADYREVGRFATLTAVEEYLTAG
jgi:hypothetical protein